MTVEETKKLVRQYFEDAPRIPDIYDEIFASIFLFHTNQYAATPTTESNPQSEKVAYEWLKSVWGDC